MRPILACVLGLTPAVITETFWALARRPDDPFVPEEIHVLTTANGRRSAENDLLGADGALVRLAAEERVAMPRLEFVVVSAPEGPLEDIRNEEHSKALADATVHLLGALTDDPETRVHASLAGGRKTMSFFMGYVLSLFGRVQDELSHVLVQPPKYERPGFWYPTAATPDARIDLAPIPFVRLRDYLNERELQRLRHGSFADVVASVQAALVPPRLVLHDGTREVEAGGRRFRLSHQRYAFYRLLAEAALEERPGAGPEGLGTGHTGWLAMSDLDDPDAPAVRRFLEIYEKVFATFGKTAERLDRALALDHGVLSDDPETLKAVFSQVRSKTNQDIRSALPSPTIHRHFVIHQDGRPSRIGLRLAPDQIKLRAD